MSVHCIRPLLEREKEHEPSLSRRADRHSGLEKDKALQNVLIVWCSGGSLRGAASPNPRRSTVGLGERGG
jgi:hypothetical protein